MKRFKIFSDNLNYIANSAGSTYKLAMNQFGDLVSL